MAIEVEKYLEDLQLISGEFYPLVLQLRNLFLKNSDELLESIKYGGIIYSKNGDLIGGIFTYKKHISVEFSYGYKLTDTDSLLEGKGKYRRHLKLVSISDMQNKKVENYIQNAIALG